MQSKWFKEKNKAIQLRLKGESLGFVEAKLVIPRSTLSGWFKGLELTEASKAKVDKNWRLRLAASRKNAVAWHNAQKAIRIQDAENNALTTLANLNIEDINIIELALSLLYLGEGSKKQSGTLIGNSDPLILRFFISILINVYSVPIKQIKADLHLRDDQNPVQLKRYWSKILNLPIQNFLGTYFDSRTKGRPTYSDYKGVCLIRCGHSEVQRKLVFLSRAYCNKIIEKFMGG